MRVVKHSDELTRGAVAATILAVPKARLDWAGGSLGWWEVCPKRLGVGFVEPCQQTSSAGLKALLLFDSFPKEEDESLKGIKWR